MRAHLERTIAYFFSQVNTKNYNTIVFESWSFRVINVRILASELTRKCSNKAVANGISICAIKLKATRTLRMFSVHQDQIQEHFTSLSKSRQTNRCNISEHKLQGLEIRVVTATIIGNNEKQVFLLEIYSTRKVLTIGRGHSGLWQEYSINKTRSVWLDWQDLMEPKPIVELHAF